MSDSRRRSVLSVLALLVLTLLPYANVFRNGWVEYDDAYMAQGRPRVRTWSAEHLRQIWTPGGNYMPLRDTFYLLDATLFGPGIAGYQATSLAWHVAGVLLLSAFVRRQWGDADIGLLAGLLFAVHPLHVEAVAWVAGSKDVMCFALSVAAALAYLRYMRGGSGRFPAAVAAMLFLVLALASKLAALAVPLVFASLELCDSDSRRSAPTVRLMRWLPFAVCAALWFVLARDSPRERALDLVGVQAWVAASPRTSPVNAVEAAARATKYWSVLRSMVLVTWRYVGLWLWPLRLSAIYTVPLEASWFRPPVLAGLLGLVGAAGGTGWLWWRGCRRTVFWLLWAGAFYLPVSNLVPVAALMNDRYVHIPSAAGSVLLAAGLVALWRRPGRAGLVARGVTIGLIGVLAVRTVHAVTAWRSPRALWERADRAQPGNVRIQITLAGLVLMDGRPAEAAQALQALETDAPDDYRRLLFLTDAYLATQRPALAARTLDRALAIYQGDVRLMGRYAFALGEQGRFADALAQARAVLELAPEQIEARLAAGLSLVRLGRTDEAVAEYAAAAAGPPNGHVAREAARALIESDRPSAALPHAESWYASDPSPVSGALYLRAMRAAGRPESAIRALHDELVSKWPDMNIL